MSKIVLVFLKLYYIYLPILPYIVGCRKKKLQGGKCPSCNGTASSKSIRLKIEVTKEEEDEGRSFTIFERDADVIFQLNLTDDTTEDNIVENLVGQLPVEIKCKIIRNNLLEIEKL